MAGVYISVSCACSGNKSYHNNMAPLCVETLKEMQTILHNVMKCSFSVKQLMTFSFVTDTGGNDRRPMQTKKAIVGHLTGF